MKLTISSGKVEVKGVFEDKSFNIEQLKEEIGHGLYWIGRALSKDLKAVKRKNAWTKKAIEQITKEGLTITIK